MIVRKPTPTKRDPDLLGKVHSMPATLPGPTDRTKPLSRMPSSPALSGPNCLGGSLGGGGEETHDLGPCWDLIFSRFVIAERNNE